MPPEQPEWDSVIDSPAVTIVFVAEAVMAQTGITLTATELSHVDTFAP